MKMKSKNNNLKKAVKNTTIPRSKFNGYRAGSNYALCFDVLTKMATKKPVKRSQLLEKYAEISGKDTKHASYDLAVILSPTEDGRYHRSADTACKRFPHFVRRSGDNLVQLVIK